MRPIIQGSLKFNDIECISKIRSLREYKEFMKRVYITENKNMDRDQYCIQCSCRDFLKDYKCGHLLFFAKNVLKEKIFNMGFEKNKCRGSPKQNK